MASTHAAHSSSRRTGITLGASWRSFQPLERVSFRPGTWPKSHTSTVEGIRGLVDRWNVEQQSGRTVARLEQARHGARLTADRHICGIVLSVPLS
jgi:hypothetical protein